MPTIRTILPQKKEEEKKLLRVAAYCRVSSDSDDQMHSFAAQTQYYKKLIGGNPLWTLADIYADEGITGTSIYEPEAETVRWIFRQYLAGQGARAIADELNAREKDSESKNGVWRIYTVQHILKNERYMGDALLQKFCTERLQGAAHKKITNKGTHTKYYVTNSHPAIISKEDFQKVQEALAKYRQQKGRANRKYSGLIKCPVCGCAFTRLKSGYWVCGSRKRLGTQCPNISVDEHSLDLAVDRVLRTIEGTPSLIEGTVGYLDRAQQAASGSQKKIKAIDRSLAETTSQLMVLTELQTQGILDAADFVDQNRGLAEQILRLRSDRRALLMSCEDEAIDQLEELQENVAEARQSLQNEDYDALNAVIDRIVVTGDTTLEVHLHGGLVLPESLPNIKRRCKRE